MREATVRQFMRRYQVDAAQAERVARFAQNIYENLNGEPSEADTTMLRWAASLHEIGISIAHTGYHKHSAYVLAQADMPGFSQKEQSRLSRLVLAHRASWPRSGSPGEQFRVGFDLCPAARRALPFEPARQQAAGDDLQSV